jgi:hypothetical protein
MFCLCAIAVFNFVHFKQNIYFYMRDVAVFIFSDASLVKVPCIPPTSPFPNPYAAKSFEWRALAGGSRHISGLSVSQESGELLVNVSLGYRGGVYYCALRLDSGKMAIVVHNVVGENFLLS